MHAPFRLLGQRPCPEYGSPRHSQVSTFTQDRRNVFLQPTEAPSVFTLFVQYDSAFCRPSERTVGEAPGRDSNPGWAG